MKISEVAGLVLEAGDLGSVEALGETIYREARTLMAGVVLPEDPSTAHGRKMLQAAAAAISSRYGDLCALDLAMGRQVRAAKQEARWVKQTYEDTLGYLMAEDPEVKKGKNVDARKSLAKRKATGTAEKVMAAEKILAAWDDIAAMMEVVRKRLRYAKEMGRQQAMCLQADRGFPE